MNLTHSTIVLDNGFRVGVTQGGHGIPLVFLHGLGVSARAYTEMLELLAANGFYVYGLDAPDHGRSDELPWGHTIADMAHIVRQALDRLNVMGESIVVGHSMGGAIAVEYAARYPGNVETVFLFNAAAGEEHHRGVAFTPGPTMPIRGARFFAGAFKDVVGDFRRAGKRRGLCEALSLAHMLRQSVSGVGSLKAVYALMKDDTKLALRTMKRFGVQTVIVHGTEDGIVPVDAAYSVWKLTGGRIHLLGGRFHSWMISEPELALEVINRGLFQDLEVS
ncbi:MAG: alpha/beta fold hydrolase [Isosphaeraceae bacterium]